MALGAGRWTVVREALGETLQVFAAGLAAGLVLAAIAVRVTATLVGDLLFGVTATDTARPWSPPDAVVAAAVPPSRPMRGPSIHRASRDIYLRLTSLRRSTQEGQGIQE